MLTLLTLYACIGDKVHFPMDSEPSLDSQPAPDSQDSEPPDSEPPDSDPPDSEPPDSGDTGGNSAPAHHTDEALSTIRGDEALQQVGFSVSLPGDLSGDGLPDLLVLNEMRPHMRWPASGSSRVGVFNSPLASEYDFDHDSSTFINPDSSLPNRWILASTGDSDGDGVGELLMGAHRYEGDESGEVWWLNGGAARSAWQGEPGARLGASLAGGVEDEGSATLLIGQPWNGAEGDGLGEVFVLDGADLPESLGDATILLHSESAHSGWGEAALASADLDGDGLRDHIVGAPYASGGDGGVWIFLGGVTGDRAASDADGLLQGGTGQGLGETLCAGDLDGDGTLDLASSDGGLLGRVWWWSAPQAQTLGVGDATGTISAGGAALLGRSLACGDLDGDPADELAIGAPGASEGNGQVYLFLDPALGTWRASEAQARVKGESLEKLGSALSSGVDMDGDGVGDLLIGAPGGSTLLDSGSAMLFSGAGL